MAWRILEKKFIFKHPYHTVEEWLVELPSGEKKEFFLGGGSYDFVMVTALTPKGRVVIETQYYISQQKKLISLVAGIIDDNEKPLVTAKRELLEETGYSARKWVKLGTNIKGKYIFGTVHHFLAIDATKISEPELEPAEDIVVSEVTREEFTRLVRSGMFKDVFAEVCAERALHYLENYK